MPMDSFSDLNLSKQITSSLSDMGFTKPTKVQLKTIPHCLLDNDVVVQAKTGSGKTLAFLVPLVENLTNMKCDRSSGIQAVILVPTAELASQISNVLSKLLKNYPSLTYLSVVGGKAFSGKKEEWKSINFANIVISTLGRFLEHQERNYSLNISTLRYLIIDETDCLLEKNFSEQMGSVIEYFPKNRITWLFSATQVSTVAELKRLSLRNPIYIGMDSSEIIIPTNLTQIFMKIELSDKLQALWNLLEVHKNSNTIVFLSTQKQVLFMYRLFSDLNPPYKVLQLRSNMRLDKRIGTVNLFSDLKNGCVLFATDAVSRGLDFPRVSIVIHYDLPKDLDDYVHRAGRTARFNSPGVSILMVMPSEAAFLTVLKEKNIILKQIRGNVLQKKSRLIAERASIKYSSDIELYNIAKNAFVGYLRDYAKLPPKFNSCDTTADIFVVNKLPIKNFAKSMGFKSIPEETSNLGLSSQPDLMTITVENGPFFVVKQNSICGSKRKLLVDSDDETEHQSSEDEEMQDESIAKKTISPAFVFNVAIKELEMQSTKDREYFNHVLKPKYSTKKPKLKDTE